MDIQELQNIFFGFVLSGLLGALIGIDKDIGKHRKTLLERVKKSSLPSDLEFGSIRTFALIALFGALMTWIDSYIGTGYIFTLSGLVLVSVIVGLYYTYSLFREIDRSPATELVAILTYFIGAIVLLGYAQVAVIVAIFLTFLLSSKDLLEGLGKYVSKDELRTTLKFAVIAFVILPLLPDSRFSIDDMLGYFSGRTLGHPLTSFEFFNPYSIWFFVVIMSGVSYLGYILTKFIGSNSSIIISSLLGGMVSSTATTASMTQKSLEDPKNTNSYVIGTLLASCIMFVRVFAVIAFFSGALFASFIIPGGIMFGVFLAATGYFYLKARKEKPKAKNDEGKTLRSPFRIAPALKFAGIIVLIKYISGVGVVYSDIFPERIFYSALGIVSGLADVDAITQTMAVDSSLGRISLTVAASTVVLAVISNNFVKGLIAYRLGNISFGKKVFGSFLVSIFAGFIAIIVINFIGYSYD